MTQNVTLIFFFKNDHLNLRKTSQTNQLAVVLKTTFIANANSDCRMLSPASGSFLAPLEKVFVMMNDCKWLGNLKENFLFHALKLDPLRSHRDWKAPPKHPTAAAFVTLFGTLFGNHDPIFALVRAAVGLLDARPDDFIL